MRLFVLTLTLISSFAIHAADLELKSLGDSAEGTAAKRKYGPYVGISAGESSGQSGNVEAGGRKFNMAEQEGSAIFSIEVGKSWKLKRVPVQFSVDVEGTFMQTTLEGQTTDAKLAGGAGGRTAADAVAYSADMNSLFFNLNGTFALDLYRYRARIGKFAAGFRPYIGGGFGGGQVWYRNAQTQSRAQFNKTGTDSANENLFSIDEFINSWNWYAGVEWTWKDQYSVFAEYRDFSFGDLDGLTDFSTDGYLVGFRYRY